jgi:hypothetical protein
MAQSSEIGGLADLIGYPILLGPLASGSSFSARRAKPSPANLGPCEAFAFAIGPLTAGATMTPILSTVIKSDNGTTDAGRIRAYLDDLIESLPALLPYALALPICAH